MDTGWLEADLVLSVCMVCVALGPCAALGGIILRMVIYVNSSTLIWVVLAWVAFQAPALPLDL